MHHGPARTEAILSCSARFLGFLSTRSTNVAKTAAASKMRDILLVASVAKALSEPGGVHNLEKNEELIPLSEDLVLQVLDRSSLDASKKLDFFDWCSRKPNYKHSGKTYSQIFRTICHSRVHCDEIFNLLASMKRDGLALDPRTFKLLLDFFIRNGKFDSALEILDHLEKDLATSDCLSPDIYGSVLIALVRKNQLGIALSIFLKLLEATHSDGSKTSIPNASACNELFVGLRKADMRAQFKHVFNELRKKNLYPLDVWGYNICIHAFGCWGDLATSLSLFKEMKEKGGPFSPDLCTYNTLIHILCVLGKVKDALIVWEELKSTSGHEPDAFTYRILIQGCSKSYRIEEAMKLFNEMKYNSLRPNVVVFNSLLDGLFKARRLNEACDLFEKMIEDDGVKATHCTYNILIDGLFKNERPVAAYTLFCDLKKKSNNFVDAITYSIVILHICREGNIEEALQLVEEMESRGFVVDLVTITSLLIALYRENRLDWSERLIKHIRDGNLVPAVLKWKSDMESTMKNPQSRKKDFTPMFAFKGEFAEVLGVNLNSAGDDPTEGYAGLQPDEVDEWSSSPYMDLMADQVGSTKNSLRPFFLSRGKRVEGKGESFNIDMVNTFLSIFLAKGKLSVACKLFEIFKDMGADPVIYTYNSMMSSFVKKGYFNEAWAVLHEIGENICPSDIATYNVIIQCLGKMGRADLASAVLDKLMKHGGYLDIVMYNTLINALGKAGRFDEVNKLFQQMKASGINPDVVTYNTLIEVHSKAGRLKEAYKFLKMMLDAGCVPNHITDTTLDFLEKEIEKLRYEKATIIHASSENPL